MGPALYVIAILGCGEGDAACEQVRVVEARYDSRESCMAATEGQLLRHGDLPYPVVVAQCREGGRPQAVIATDVSLPEAEGGRQLPRRRRGGR